MPKYQIVGADLQTVVCDLAAGESVIAEAGHLLALTDGLEFDTHTGGGIMAGIKRAIGGSSFFVNEIKAQTAGRAIFASPSPGKIQELDVGPGRGWLCQPHVFLCSDPGVVQAAALTKRFGAGLFGGTGFILQSLEGAGKAFVHVGGTSMHLTLAAGQTLRVETGSLAAFEASVTYDIQMISGFKSILFGGEGMWFAHLTGPGGVYLQSLGLAKLAHSIIPYLPATHSNTNESLGAAAIGSVIGSILNSRNE
jgi:uncharacterized protein (TIGR00266 family)